MADRENGRLQFFDIDGKFIRAWDHVQRPSALAINAQGHIYLGESPDGPPVPSRHFFGDVPVPGRVSMYSLDGELLARVTASGDSLAPGHFVSIHGIAVDAQGGIYTTENAYSGSKALGLEYDDRAVAFQKWVPSG